MPQYYWPANARTKHLYIAGRSGYGKSTTMFSLALADIKAGRAVIVIDPKGDLVAAPPDPAENGRGGLLYHIPDEHRDRCFFISPKHPVPLDFMSWREEWELETALNDIVSLFHRLDPTWGVRMGALLKYAVLTLLLVHRTNFMEIHKILVDTEWRDELLNEVRASTTIPAEIYKDVLRFWDKDFPKLPKDATSPITISRMSDFVLSSSLRKFLGSGRQLNLQDIIETNQVLLVSLGAVGAVTDTSMILGSMLISKIQQAVFRRESIPVSQRKPVSLYVDEFQNFRTTAFNVMLSQARGFNLSACLANQHPKQIEEFVDDIKGCVSSYLFFRMAADHAAIFKSEILSFDADPHHATRSGIENRLKNLTLDAELAWKRAEHLPRAPGGWRDSQEMRELDYKIKEAQARLELLPPARLTAPLERFSTLPVGQAFYSAADGTRQFVNTPGPPEFPHTELARNAEYIMKRTVGKYPCAAHPDRATTSDGNHSTWSGDVNPGGDPNVPPHGGQKKKS